MIADGTQMRPIQIVHTDHRGDDCYRGKSKGWYFHQLDENFGIIVSSIIGPFSKKKNCIRVAKKYGKVINDGSD